jgi:hypothetical protein
MAEDNNLGVSFSKTLKESDLTELIADVSDDALEAAGNVPVIGYLQKIWNCEV